MEVFSFSFHLIFWDGWLSNPCLSGLLQQCMAELSKEKNNTGSNAHAGIKALCKFPDYHFMMMMVEV